MNKRISDLLDHYADESVDLAGDSPLSSARIKELTMKKINEEKRPKLRRLPVRVAAAAAVIAALTVSTLAARIFGAGDLMQGMFGRWTDEPLSTAQVEILNGMGHVFEDSEARGATSNGATITPIAALADEDSYCVQLRVEAPEGTVLPDLDDWATEGIYYLDGFSQGTFMEIGISYSSYHGTGLPMQRAADTFGNGFLRYSGGFRYNCITLPDSDPTDNVKDIVLTLYSNNFKDIKLNDGNPKRLSVKGLWIERWDESDPRGFSSTPVFQGDFILDIGGTFESPVVTIDCGGAEWTDPDTGEVNWADTMKLSPLGLKFEFRSNLMKLKNGRNWIDPVTPGDVRVVMKDGSEIFLEYGHSIWSTDEHDDPSDPYFQVTPDLLTETPEWELGVYRAFEKPLDLSQVDYVQLGEDHIYHITTE